MDRATVTRIGVAAYQRAKLSPLEIPDGGAAMVADRLDVMVEERDDAATVATLTTREEGRVIRVISGLHEHRLNWLVGHELAHHLLDDHSWFWSLPYDEREAWCDRLGSWLCCPGPSFVLACGDCRDLGELSQRYALTQSAVAMRLAEEGLELGVDVLTPHRVHRRGSLPWDVSEARARARLVNTRRIAITDEPGRCALVA